MTGDEKFHIDLSCPSSLDLRALLTPGTAGGGREDDEYTGLTSKTVTIQPILSPQESAHLLATDFILLETQNKEEAEEECEMVYKL